MLRAEGSGRGSGIARLPRSPGKAFVMGTSRRKHCGRSGLQGNIGLSSVTVSAEEDDRDHQLRLPSSFSGDLYPVLTVVGKVIK
jgi:hypothetical protein